MTSRYNKFQVNQLRMKNAVKALEGILVLVACFLVAAFLPQLLIQYIYADQQLFAQPALLQYLPVVIFVVGIAYFLFAMFGNLRREMEAQKLEKEVKLEMSMDDCCGGACGHHDHDMMLGSAAESMSVANEGSTTSIAQALKSSSSTKGRKANKRK